MLFDQPNKKLLTFFQPIISSLIAFILTLSISVYWSDYIPTEYATYIFSITVLLLYVGLQTLTTYIYERYFLRAKHIFFSEQPLVFTPHTTETLKKWQSDVITYLNKSEALKHPVIFLYDWRMKRYVELFSESVTSFPANHALAYITKQQQLRVVNEQSINELPEVIGLDIKFLLRQYQVNAALPLGVSTTSVCGFIFGISSKLTNQEVEVIQKHYGQMLEHILQHDAIINPAKPKDPAPSHLSWPMGVTILAFLLLTIWWILTLVVQELSTNKFIFSFTHIYGVMAVWGGIWGLIAAKYWKKQRHLSYALIMFSLGLFLQEFGQISYATYNWIWKIRIPYPSIGDVGFFGSIPCYIFGVIFLAKSCGINLRFKTYKNRVIAFMIPSIMLFLAYILFLQDYIFDFSNPLKIILDFAYPLTQAIYVSLAILTYLLTRDSGGKMKNLVLMILLALIWQFICDYTFLYQAYHDAWIQNGINDYMYFVSYFLMASILIGFKLARSK